MTAFTPYGWTPATSTPNQSPNIGNQGFIKPIQNNKNQPSWYNDLLKIGAKRYQQTGGIDPAGMTSGSDWFNNYYGGYSGNTPVQSGLLKYAGDSLINMNQSRLRGYGAGSQNIVNDFLGRYQPGFRGNNSVSSAFRQYLKSNKRGLGALSGMY